MLTRRFHIYPLISFLLIAFSMLMSSCGGSGNSSGGGSSSGGGGGPSPLPSLRTSLGNLDAAPVSFGSSKAAAKLVVFDNARQEVFASNTLLNEVEVFSAVTRQKLATISVPTPYGIDISADGSAVYVGTFSDFLYVIDPQQLAVVRRISFAAPTTFQGGGTVNSPQALATLSNGKIMLLMDFGDQFGLANGTSLLIWDPTNNTTTTLLSNTSNLGPIARSGDHSKVAFTSQVSGGAGTGVGLYDVATGQVTNGVYSGGGIPFALAVNGDGSEVAVGGGLALQTYDGRMTPQNSVNLTNSTAGILFSSDGAKIYHFIFCVRAQVFDAKTLQQIGQVSDIGLEAAGSLPGDIDTSGIVYGLTDHGLSFLDVSKPTRTSDAIIGMDFAVPQAGPQGVATPVVIGVGGTTATPDIAFGSLPGLNVSASPFQQGEKISATAPPSSKPGPVNVFVEWPDGLSWLEAEDFSYGPSLRYLFETGGPPQGGVVGALAGYGFGWNLGPPQIFFGSNTATVNSLAAISNFIEPYPYQQLQLALMTLPQGQPGRADVKIVSPVGTITVSGGFHYMNQVNVVPLAPNQLLEGAWDKSRHRIYYSAGSQIQVFSTDSLQFMSPITVPSTPAGISLTGIALTPDDSKLLVADAGGARVLLIDPVSPSSVTAVNLTLPPIGLAVDVPHPSAIATTNTGKAIVIAPSDGGPIFPAVREIDLATLTVTGRSDALSYDSSAIMRSAQNGAELMIQEGDGASLYLSSSDSFTGAKQVNLGGVRDGAI